MSTHKYLVLLRSSPPSGPSGPSSPSSQSGPSPEQMQKMFATYNAWKEKFKDQILDMGDKLMPAGRVVTASGMADGPFVEAKEVVGGFMIVAAETIDGAAEVARACPAIHMPGVSMEIREMSGAKM